MWLKSSTTIEKTQSNTKGNTPPEYPTIHQQWIDTSGEKPILKEWDGNAWIAVESDVTKLDPQFTTEVTEKLAEAHNNALEAIQDATEALEKADGVSGSVNEAVNEAKDALQKAQDAMDNLVTFKEETTGKITEINGSFNGLQTTVNDRLDEQETQINQTQGLVNVVASNGVNLFPFGGNFENGIELSTYINNSSAQPVIVENQWKTEINNTSKAMKMIANKKGSVWVNFKDEYATIEALGNDKFHISFVYLKNTTDGKCELSLKGYNTEGTEVIKKTVGSNVNTGTSWTKLEGDIEMPKEVAKIKIVLGITGVSSSSTVLIDKINIRRTEVTQTDLNVTKDGLQAQFQSVDNKVGQVTASVNGLTTQFNNYKTETDTRFNVVDGSINGMIKKGELISQFNIEAGKTLINSSKQIVLSSENIIFDSANPVQIPGGLLTGQVDANLLKAGRISSRNNKTFFDLDNNLMKTESDDGFFSELSSGKLNFGNTEVTDAGYIGSSGRRLIVSSSGSNSESAFLTLQKGSSFRLQANTTYFEGTPGVLTLSVNGRQVANYLNDRVMHQYGNSIDELGTTWKQVTIEGNKTLDIHKDYIDVAFGGLKRTIKKSSLPDGTTTMYIGTSDNKSGIHITGGNVYLELNGSTYAFDTKYLRKL